MADDKKKDQKKDKKTAAAAKVTHTYPFTEGNRVKFYVMASDTADGTAGAFADIAKAIKAAQHFVFVVDWSFQPLTRIAPRTGKAALTDTIGHLLLDATKKEGMLVAIHTWDHTNVATPDPMNDNGNTVLDELAEATGFGKKRPANLLWRMSSRTGVGFSHHQKFVVLDADEGDGRRVVKAFFGGLDLTKGRFDFPGSPFLPPGSAVEPFVPGLTLKNRAQDDWYNLEFGDDLAMPRQAWQDFCASIVGPSAWDVLREFVGRWNRTAGSLGFAGPGDSHNAARVAIRQKFLDVFDKGKFVQAFEPHNGPYKARVLRSQERAHWGPTLNTDTTPDSDTATETPTANGSTQTEFGWVVSEKFERSIQLSYLNAIKNADRFIYVETQYLISSGNRWGRSSVRNSVCEEIAKKIVDRINRDKEFHAYIVIPMFPEGPPIKSAAPSQRNFEFNTMRFMAQDVFAAANAKGKDWRDFLSFYFLANWTVMDGKTKKIAPIGTRQDRVRSNERYQVYVHSKLMIIDDQFLILGSANLNERSLAGDRDSEICLSVQPTAATVADVKKGIGDFRKAIWAAHVDLNLVPNLDFPETAMCAKSLRALGRENWQDMTEGKRLRKGQLIHIPFLATDTTFAVEAISRTADLRAQDTFILDAEAKAAGTNGNGTVIDNAWLWGPTLGVSDVPFKGAAE